MVTPCRTVVRSFRNCICSESVTNIWCYFFLAKIHEFRNQVIKMEEIPLTVIPSDLLANFCFLFLWLRSAGLKVLVPKGLNASTRGHNSDSIELKIKTSSQPLCVPHACESTGKKGYRWTIDPVYWETGPLLHDGGKRECVWNTGDPLGYLGTAMSCD